jgi:hypothetical protein
MVDNEKQEQQPAFSFTLSLDERKALFAEFVSAFAPMIAKDINVIVSSLNKIVGRVNEIDKQLTEIPKTADLKLVQEKIAQLKMEIDHLQGGGIKKTGDELMKEWFFGEEAK